MQGALLASVALQALNLPLITEVSFFVRGMFTISAILSILATFFTCIQQRELGVVTSAPALRAWFSNGVRYENAQGRVVYQSSMAAYQLLESPYEIISIAIGLLVGGITAYLGSAWVENLRLSVGGRLGNIAVISCFTVGTGFAFVLFPLLLASKTRECEFAGNELLGLDLRRVVTDNRNTLRKESWKSKD
ncbi:hypothetical protein GQ44DRAFT_712407 [Phaeosphaeriaceae sp. PMI808]|nr:hypothetical protein GQ44DRAFT_712407 [Phaeosphaeriaceae sp. PMI808]